MSKRDRGENSGIVVIAFTVFMVIFALMGYFWGLEKGYTDGAEVDAQEHHEDAGNYIESTCVGMNHTRFVECVNKAVETSGEYQRAQHDLAAQQQMAEFAKWLLILTAVTVGITALGIFWVKQTLEATYETASVTRKSSRDETRAYVHIQSIHVRNYFDEGEHWAECTLYVENSGATPCKRFEIDGGAVCSVDHAAYGGLPVHEGKPSGWSALPSDDVLTARKRFKIIGFEALEHEYYMHIGGVVRYSTFFNEDFETEFSFMLRSSFWDNSKAGDKEIRMSRTTLKIRSYEQIN